VRHLMARGALEKQARLERTRLSVPASLWRRYLVNNRRVETLSQEISAVSTMHSLLVIKLAGNRLLVARV